MTFPGVSFAFWRSRSEVGSLVPEGERRVDQEVDGGGRDGGRVGVGVGVGGEGETGDEESDLENEEERKWLRKVSHVEIYTWT